MPLICMCRTSWIGEYFIEDRQARKMGCNPQRGRLAYFVFDRESSNTLAARAGLKTPQLQKRVI